MARTGGFLPEDELGIPEGTLCRGMPIRRENDEFPQLIEGRVALRRDKSGRSTWLIDETPVEHGSVLVLQPGIGSGKELHYSFSGYGPACRIDYEGDLLTYSNHGWGLNENADLPITNSQWSGFMKKINEAGVWSWGADYQPKSWATDGPWWLVIIEAGGRRVVSQGYQAYPRSFERFRRALRLLIGDRPYE